LPARESVDGQALQDGVIHVAVPDHHLLVEGHATRLTRGPKEHHTRPSVDPLFLSAALSHGPGVIGVVLTGRGDDGTFGLDAIKRCGGIAVVQRPHTAEEPSMPMSALRHVAVDYSVRIEEMGELLARVLGEDPPPTEVHDAAGLEHELDLLLAKGDAMEHLQAIATPSTFVCPDCSGSLWELKQSDPTRFRCHVGHGFTATSLLAAQTESTDAALWTAIRSLQERGILLEKLSAVYEGDDPGRQRELSDAARDAASHADMLRKLVESGPNLVDQSR
jgi:two-component system chemotaxis response regulator CheB